jgi:hypothetical protein
MQEMTSSMSLASSTQFESERSYSKFAVFTIIEHQGNFTASAKALREQGYGEARKELQTLEVHSPCTSSTPR